MGGQSIELASMVLFLLVVYFIFGSGSYSLEEKSISPTCNLKLFVGHDRVSVFNVLAKLEYGFGVKNLSYPGFDNFIVKMDRARRLV